MNKLARQASIVAALIILFGSVLYTVYLGSLKKPPQRKFEATIQIPEIEVISVKNQNVSSAIDIQGRLVAFDKIDVFSEVTGVLKSDSPTFKIGSRFKKGAVMLKIDDEEARLSLLAQKSNLLNAVTQIMPDLKIDYPESFPQWEKYLHDFDVDNAIQPLPKPQNDQEKYFIASKNLYSQFYNIRSAETRLEKYTIYAPFSGVVTQAGINPGSLVRTGQKLGELMNTGVYELQVTVPLSQLDYIRTGSKVDLISDDISGQWAGRVKRINDQIDPTTQSVIVYIGVSGVNLKEGMYLRGEITAKDIPDAFEVPREAVVNQKAVYLVRDSVLALAPITLVKMKNQTAIVKGLENGVLVASKKLPGAYEGMKVSTK